MPTVAVTPAQKVEKLETFSCQQAMQYGPECGELADYRVINQGISVTLCDVHATPYLKGQQLEAVPCSRCTKSCKPGYVFDQDSGRYFCTQRCRDLWYVRINDRDRVRYR